MTLEGCRSRSFPLLPIHSTQAPTTSLHALLLDIWSKISIRLFVIRRRLPWNSPARGGEGVGTPTEEGAGEALLLSGCAGVCPRSANGVSGAMRGVGRRSGEPQRPSWLPKGEGGALGPPMPGDKGSYRSRVEADDAGLGQVQRTCSRRAILGVFNTQRVFANEPPSCARLPRPRRWGRPTRARQHVLWAVHGRHTPNRPRTSPNSPLAKQDYQRAETGPLCSAARWRRTARY